MVTAPLNQKTYQSFRVNKTFKTLDKEACITSLDFDDSGQYLMSTLTNESINLYDTYKGSFLKPIYSKKYGCHLAKFTHEQKNCVYASTKEDNTIRYLSLYNNSYIRYFKGHKGLITSLEVSPINNVIASASLDNTVKLWDLRSSSPQMSIKASNTNHIAFDPAGLVLAIGTSSIGKISLREIKGSQTEAPFLFYHLPKNFKFNKIEFSNDNRLILVSSIDMGYHLILDAWRDKIVTKLRARPIPFRQWPHTGTACFTPDGKFVFAGIGDGTVGLWKLDKENVELYPEFLDPIITLQGDSKPRMCAFNPKLLELITADEDLVSLTFIYHCFTKKKIITNIFLFSSQCGYLI